MGIKNKCRDCGNEFERGFISMAKCPKCGGRNLLLIKPSRGTGCAIACLGSLMLFLVVLDIVTGFWQSRIGVTLLAFAGVFVTAFGATIAFMKRE
jgi:DNA-directed RNA polymerase subunit RPC12/RpoP